MKILAYSDLHYHDYTNGVTLQDVVNVEMEVIELAAKHDVDLVVFCGDRFVSRNPHYDVLLAATRTIDAIMRKLDVPFIYLIGNHDQTVKNHIGSNTAEHLSMNKYSNLYTIDKKSHLDMNTHAGMVRLHAVPAGTENVNYKFEKLDNAINVCLYHGMIKNAKYDTGILNTDGHDCSFLDNDIFDLLICGDNHRHQKLDMFVNVPAWYVGATMQHKWAETETKRGFMLFEVGQGPVTAVHIESKAPKFLIADVSASDDIQSKILAAADVIDGNIVKLIITGTGEQMAGIDNKFYKEYLYKVGAKFASVCPKYVLSQVKQAKTKTDKEMWYDLLKQSSDKLDGMNIDDIYEQGLKYID